uniref:Uncharacterized protein n=1 Tax=Megaselia scalaris TaxID=36166 RepID=T1GK27_MEGSC
MEDLEERFGRSDLLVEDQLKALRAFPSIAESKIHLLVEFADKLRNFKNFLIISECEIKEIIEKLPINSQIEWAKKAATFSRKATLVDISKWLIETAHYLIQSLNVERYSKVLALL